jgi:hypothetical protein
MAYEKTKLHDTGFEAVCESVVLRTKFKCHLRAASKMPGPSCRRAPSWCSLRKAPPSAREGREGPPLQETAVARKGFVRFRGPTALKGRVGGEAEEQWQSHVLDRHLIPLDSLNAGFQRSYFIMADSGDCGSKKAKPAS